MALPRKKKNRDSENKFLKVKKEKKEGRGTFVARSTLLVNRENKQVEQAREIPLCFSII